MATHGISRRSLLRGAIALGAVTAAPGLGRAGAAWAAPAAQAHRHGPHILLDWLDVLYAEVRAERCSPPSAARIYGACAVAAYEAVVGGAPTRWSLGGQLNGLPALPRPAAAGRTDWRVAANSAIGRVAVEAFADRSERSRAALAAHAASSHDALSAEIGRDVAALSARHGNAVGDALARWLSADGYRETRGLTYEPPVGPGLWEPTPPNFGVAIEPHWERVRPFALASADQCAPPAHLPYSESHGSPFFAQATAVHEASRHLTDEQRMVAMYWRDNPDGSTGLPSGHWMQIAAEVAAGEDLVGAAELMALVGIVLADAFTSCWTEKYRSNLLRPVTYIRRVLDPTWTSYVNSPAFPEYTSGHSVGSAAAARVLTRLAGTRPFTDASAAERGFVPRSFSSFEAAADEAAVSRLHGGIHYPMAIEVGLEQGVSVADSVLARLRTRVGG